MIKKLTCIQCPKGCQISVQLKNGAAQKISGAQCTKGENYAEQEIENPQRVISSTVRTRGLSLKRVPVKLSCPVPKDKIFAVMQEIKKVCLSRPTPSGEIILKNIAATKANLIATREAAIYTDDKL
jgi:CxxC motif-containing protein